MPRCMRLILTTLIWFLRRREQCLCHTFTVRACDKQDGGLRQPHEQDG